MHYKTQISNKNPKLVNQINHKLSETHRLIDIHITPKTYHQHHEVVQNHPRSCLVEQKVEMSANSTLKQPN